MTFVSTLSNEISNYFPNLQEIEKYFPCISSPFVLRMLKPDFFGFTNLHKNILLYKANNFMYRLNALQRYIHAKQCHFQDLA